MRLTLLLWFIISGCSSRYITQTWTASDHSLDPHLRVLIIGIIKEKDMTLRTLTEDKLAYSFGKLGYIGIPAIDKFGVKGLAALNEEATYLKLCENDIDAILTVALIDKKKQAPHFSTKAFEHPDEYFYYRIWNYSKIQADISTDNLASTDFYWEVTLFDLRSLSPLCSLQTDCFVGSAASGMLHIYMEQVIRKMIKEGVLIDRKKS